MKKTTITILLLVFYSSLFSQNGSGIVKYSVKLNFTLEDIEKEEKEKGKRLETMRELIAKTKDTEAILKFTSTNGYSSVSKRMQIKERNNGLDLVYSRAGSEKIFYTDLIMQTNTIQECKIFEKCYLIIQPKLEWKLTQESKLIGGYLCYKAINTSSKNTKQKPIAWYAPQIPASFGPKHYFGLPGLILELEETAIIFKVKNITLNPKNEVEIIPKKGTKISEENYKAKQRREFSQFFEN
ncbi:GLPGLI family protein [Polaribacter sp. R77954]|uniref:GLPGLI family protein n=1 Tax=Polaribacter sp. R77954 TaxID=3093870 RepID=UPI0037C7455A